MLSHEHPSWTAEALVEVAHNHFEAFRYHLCPYYPQSAVSRLGGTERYHQCASPPSIHRHSDHPACLSSLLLERLGRGCPSSRYQEMLGPRRPFACLDSVCRAIGNVVGRDYVSALHNLCGPHVVLLSLEYRSPAPGNHVTAHGDAPAVANHC